MPDNLIDTGKGSEYDSKCHNHTQQTNIWNNEEEIKSLPATGQPKDN